ncbi:putative membrane protein [Brucella rhizosphaerae]|uniref:Putative membrane protein n=1 Tax=Brucella rhizosphaerae TaxID=571254 RepID=A0A256F4N9_9HYPH|nr:putative membrane protein [Brucella rhizosphaerae]
MRLGHETILFQIAAIIPGLVKFYKKRACAGKSRGASLFLKKGILRILIPVCLKLYPIIFVGLSIS